MEALRVLGRDAAGTGIGMATLRLDAAELGLAGAVLAAWAAIWLKYWSLMY